MPSLLARVMGTFLRLTGTYRKRYSGGPGFPALIADVRTQKLDEPTAKMLGQLAISRTEFQGRTVWQIAPKDRAPTAHMLFFHGGGYVFSAVAPHFQTWANLAAQHGIAITAPLYPLAPESEVIEATDFAMACYRDFIAKHDGPFIMGGDSAGGGLCAATAQTARDEGLRAASGLILICPWLDVTVSHPDQPAIEKRDSILMIRGAREAGALYARDTPVTDKRVSPINGDWQNLPPILCFSGGDDILLVDSRALKAKLPDMDYVEGTGLMHDWPLFFFSESKEAQARMGAFAAARAG
jgi:epsilon-lactone hydrolase